MKKLLAIVSTFSVITLFSVTQAFALTIDTIGSSSTTSGNPGTEWYYTAQNPNLSGTADVSSTVTIDIDGTAFSTTSDASGNWSYQPTTLTNGDHTVIVSDTTSSITFTMHIGETASSTKGGTSTASDSAETLPVSGAMTNTLMLLGGGGIMIYAGIKLQKATQQA